jgi:hypothetical protein
LGDVLLRQKGGLTIISRNPVEPDEKKDDADFFDDYCNGRMEDDYKVK